MSEKRDSLPPIFKTMKAVFMFSFVLGVRNGVRVGLSSRVEIFDVDVFDRDDDLPLLNGVYLADTFDLEGLSSSDHSDERVAPAVLKMAEEYAFAGSQIVLSELNMVNPERSLLLMLASGSGPDGINQ
jgi:dnd system-associated protein 4